MSTLLPPARPCDTPAPKIEIKHRDTGANRCGGRMSPKDDNLLVAQLAGSLNADRTRNAAYDEAFNEAYDCARAGLVAGAPAVHALLGELVLEGDDDLDMLMAAMRHAMRGDMQRAGVMVMLLAGAVLHRHATLVADLEAMKVSAARHALLGPAPEGRSEKARPA